MPADSLMVVSLIVALFVVFMATLYWAWTQAH
jgi:hypothetical protein